VPADCVARNPPARRRRPSAGRAGPQRCSHGESHGKFLDSAFVGNVVDWTFRQLADRARPFMMTPLTAAPLRRRRAGVEAGGECVTRSNRPAIPTLIALSLAPLSQPLEVALGPTSRRSARPLRLRGASYHGVHDDRSTRSRSPRSAFTMRRSRCSRSADPGVHDAPKPAPRRISGRRWSTSSRRSLRRDWTRRGLDMWYFVRDEVISV